MGRSDIRAAAAAAASQSVSPLTPQALLATKLRDGWQLPRQDERGRRLGFENQEHGSLEHTPPPPPPPHRVPHLGALRVYRSTRLTGTYCPSRQPTAQSINHLHVFTASIPWSRFWFDAIPSVPYLQSQSTYRVELPLPPSLMEPDYFFFSPKLDLP